MEIKNIEINKKLYKFFLEKYSVTFGQIQKFCREKSIKINNSKVNENYILQENDIININSFALKILSNNKKQEKIENKKSIPQTLMEKIKKSIIYEDENILSINKPYGLSIQGGTGINISLNDLLPYISDNKNLKLVHRLDKDTTGVLIIAKNETIAEILSKNFKNKNNIEKKYLAVVNGILKNKEDTINLPLIKKNENNTEKVYVDKAYGKEAITKYKLLDYNKKLNISLLEIIILTGRTHQIRVHMKELGNYVIGDFKYGKLDGKKISNKMLLHSYKTKLSLFGKEITIEADIPDNFKELFNYFTKNQNK